MEDKDVKELEINEDQTAERKKEGEKVLWGNEAGNLKTRDEIQGNWFTPPVGTTKIRFLSDGRKETREYDDGVKDVVVFDIELLSVPDNSDYEEGAECAWSVTHGVTEVSLFGQIAKVGAKNDGLEGKEITLIRQGQGNDTQYAVPEAADISLDEVRG